MGLPSKDSPLSSQNTPTEQQVSRFAETRKPAHGPQIPKLKVDVATPKLMSAWNKEVIELVTKHFLKTVILTRPVDKTIIAPMVKSYLLTLRRRYVKDMATPSPTQVQNIADRKAKNNEVERRRGVRFLVEASVALI